MIFVVVEPFMDTSVNPLQGLCINLAFIASKPLQIVNHIWSTYDYKGFRWVSLARTLLEPFIPTRKGRYMEYIVRALAGLQRDWHGSA